MYTVIFIIDFILQAVGEPPLFLASSIYFAIREAIKAARKDASLAPTAFKLTAPATSAKIRMACQDNITSKVSNSVLQNKHIY